MKIKELMERIPSINEGYSIAYANDAVKEIASMIEDKITFSPTIDIVKDQRFYDPPSGMLKLVNVFVLDTDATPNKYVKISRVVDTNTQDDD